MRKKIRSIHIILFVMLFLVGSFINISTIHAEAGSRTGSIQIIYKGRNSSDKEVALSGAKFSIFPIQYMKNDELVWENGFKDSGISLQDTSAEAREKQAKQLYAFAKENDISGLMQETDSSGRTSFGELDEGIYLIAQKHSQKSSEESGKNNLAKTQDLCYTKDKVQVTGAPSGLCG